MFLRSLQQVKKSPNLQGIARFDFDELGYVSEAAHARSESKWTGILKWKDGKHSFLVHHSPALAYIIPKRFFGSPSDIAAVGELLRTKVPRK